MLEWMQRHKKWLVITVWISAFALVFGFYFQDIYSYFVGGGNNIAKVGNEYVSREDYEREYRLAYDNIREMYPNFEAQFGSENGEKIKEIEDIAFNNLVRRQLLKNLADDLGISASENEVAHEIMYGETSKYFLGTNNRFDENVYKDMLAQNNLSTQRFEAGLAQDLSLRKIQGISEFPISNLESSALFSIGNISDELNIKIVSKDSILQGVEIKLSENELKKYYEENKAKYMKPAEYKIAYIGIKESDLDSIESNVSESKNTPANGGATLAQDSQSGANLATKDSQNADNMTKDELKNNIIAQASGYLSSMEKNIKKNIESNKEIFTKSFANLNKDSINLLKNSIESDKQVELDSIPINFLVIDDNDFMIYQNLLAMLPNANVGILAPIKEDSINGEAMWIVPYIVEKSQKSQLSYEDSKENVKNDLMDKKKKEEFNKGAKAMLANLKDSDYEKIGYISMSDFGAQNIESKIATNMINMLISNGISPMELSNVLRQIMTASVKKDVIMAQNAAVFFNISNQKMPSEDDMLNITNMQIDEAQNLKNMDMMRSLFEYAQSKYEIIDYRRQN